MNAARRSAARKRRNARTFVVGTVFHQIAFHKGEWRARRLEGLHPDYFSGVKAPPFLCDGKLFDSKRKAEA
jgi:hypothetical protein